MEYGGCYSMSWPELESERTQTFSSMLSSGEFTDVTLACDDDQIQAHKIILTAASPLFQNIFRRNPHSNPLLYFHGVSKQEMEIVLDFIYSGEAKVPMEDLDTFLKIANNLKVRGLVDLNDISGANSSITDENQIQMANKSPDEKKFNQHAFKVDEFATDEIVDKKVSHYRDIIEQSSVETHNEAGMDIIEETSVEMKCKPNIDSSQEEKIESLLTKTDSGTWECKECHLENKRKSHIKEHVETHIEGLEQRCTVCLKIFKNRPTLRTHFRKCIGRTNN